MPEEIDKINIKDGSLWALFYETSLAIEDSFKKMYSVAKQSMGQETADKIKASQRSSLRGAVPLIVYSILTIVVLLIIYLIWRN